MQKSKKLLLILGIIFLSIIISISSLFITYKNKENIVVGIFHVMFIGLEHNREEETGSYNVVDWADGTFQINQFYAIRYLEMPKENYNVILLRNVQDYKIKNKKLFIIAKQGYAVIDKENNAQIFISLHEEGTKDEFTSSYGGAERFYSICYKDKHIKYLNSFDEFSEKDKKIFYKMQKKGDNK